MSARVIAGQLRSARHHQRQVEDHRSYVLGHRDEKGGPAFGFGFARHITTTALRAGIIVAHLMQQLNREKIK